MGIEAAEVRETLVVEDQAEDKVMDKGRNLVTPRKKSEEDKLRFAPYQDGKGSSTATFYMV